MNYKGYEASVSYDAEDKILVGRVLNTRDVIVFDGESVSELESSFQAVVDEYLADCATQGKDPEKPFSGRFNVRLSPDLHRQVVVQAEQAGMSLNSFVEETLAQRVSVS